MRYLNTKCSIRNTHDEQTHEQWAGNIVGRMYSVSLRDVEMFDLKVFLFHSLGTPFYEDLNAIEWEFVPSFKDTCIRLSLLKDDEEQRNTFRLAVAFRTQLQLINYSICLLI